MVCGAPVQLMESPAGVVVAVGVKALPMYGCVRLPNVTVAGPLMIANDCWTSGAGLKLPFPA